MNGLQRWFHVKLVAQDLDTQLVPAADAARLAESGVTDHQRPERVLASATALPFKSESFDVLVANHTLEYVPSVPKALAEMARVLGANGLVYLAAVNRLKFLPVPLLPRSLKGAFFDLFHAGESNIGHPLAYWEWRERLREFLSTDGTIDVLEYADPSVSSATTRIARSIPLPILQLMAPLFPSWIFYLHKAPRTG